MRTADARADARARGVFLRLQRRRSPRAAVRRAGRRVDGLTIFKEDTRYACACPFEGVDVVMDPVGGDIFDLSLKCLAPEGRLLVVGAYRGAARRDVQWDHTDEHPLRDARGYEEPDAHEPPPDDELGPLLGGGDEDKPRRLADVIQTACTEQGCSTPFARTGTPAANSRSRIAASSGQSSAARVSVQASSGIVPAPTAVTTRPRRLASMR